MSSYRDFLQAIDDAQNASVTAKDVVPDASNKGGFMNKNTTSQGLLSDLKGDLNATIEAGTEAAKTSYDNILEWLDVSVGYQQTKKEEPKDAVDPEQVVSAETDLKLSPSEMSAKEKSRGLVTAKQTGSEYSGTDIPDPLNKVYPSKTTGMKGLKKDALFNDGLARLKQSHPNIGEKELFRMIQGESNGVTHARNKKSGAVSLWQVTQIALDDLKDRKIAPKELTLSRVRDMDAGEQMDLYSKYLDRWGYDGTQTLGLLQAAPAFAKSPPETVVYKKGSKAWDQNSVWRTKDVSGKKMGPITVDSINNYYKSQEVQS